MDAGRSVVIVVEPDLNLADALHDTLMKWGFQVATFSTHRAAATSALSIDYIALLAACIPTSDDDREGAYLEEAAGRQTGKLPVILMLADPADATPSAAQRSVRLLKPFTSDELWAAMKSAGVRSP